MSPEKTITRALPKEAWVGLVSSLMEAYNMAIYSFMAPLLAKMIFPEHTASSAVFFSYCLVFVGSCLLYPAGAVYYGLLGDKRGRQKTCTYSTLGLAVATGMMGLIPFGDNAWICFLLCIGAQHFFSGGEYHGSIVFSLEHGKEQKSGLMSATSCLFAVFGLSLASGLATLSLLSHSEIWMRACFLIGAIGGLISYLLKNHCRETPAFAALPQDSLKTVHLLSFIKAQWRKIAAAAVVMAFFIVSYSFLFLFLPLMRSASHTFDTLHSLIAYGLFLVAAGLIADRMGIKKVMALGASLFAVAIIPLCYLCSDLFALQVILTFFACLVIGPIHSWMLHHFEVHERCRGIFVSAAIATSLFGGSTVPICLMIFEKSQSLALCCMYPLVIALCCLSVLIAQKKQAFA